MAGPDGAHPPGPSLFGKKTRKPNSVLCGLSSRRRVAAVAHQRPTRRFRQWLEPPCRIGPMRSRSLALGSCFPPYLVLLRVGFTLPQPLLPARCALTAPFHPYHCMERTFGRDPLIFPCPLQKPAPCNGGMFSVALAVHGPLRPRPGRYPAHCPAEFGLSSPGSACASPAAAVRPACT